MNLKSPLFFALLGAVVVLVVIGGVSVFNRGAKLAAPDLQPENSLSLTELTQVSEPGVVGPTVTYTDEGYSPATISVKKGQSVTFQNESARNMWTASDPHPTHQDYPTSGGCETSTFDSCKGTPPGQSWSFTFDAIGEWNYHDHLRPSRSGAVTVTQ